MLEPKHNNNACFRNNKYNHRMDEHMILQSLDFGLDETLIALRDSIAAFCAKEIAPIAQQVDRDNEFPAQLWKKFGDMGLLGLTVSEEYGGTNLGYLAHIIAMQEISRASASIGLS